MPEPSAEVPEEGLANGSTPCPSKGAARRIWPGTTNAPIKFKRAAANCVFFQGLLAAQAGQLPGSPLSQVRRLGEIADRHQRTLRRGPAHPGGPVTRTCSTAYGLADRRRPGRAGLAGDGATANCWQPAWTMAETWAYADASMRTPEWLSTLDRHRDARRGLVARHARWVRHQPRR